MGATTDSSLETQLIGRTINGYRVTELLGRGGMGAVYAAELSSEGAPNSGAAPRIALKILHGRLAASDPTAVDRFVNEARATSRVSHPGLVKVLDFGHLEDGCAYIMMELLSGVLMRQRIRERAPMPYIEVCRLGRQIADALRAAHAIGIVHRDLKPENFMIIAEPPSPASPSSSSSALLGAERVKVLDFGLAKIVAATAHETLPGYKTATGVIMGTPTYMSPELCRANGGKIDDRSDVYSLAVVLFEMLAGRPPFQARAPGELIAMHILEPAPGIETFVENVPRGLQELLARMLAKKPEARPSMAGVCRTLTTLLTEGPTQPLTKLGPQDLKTTPLPASARPVIAGRSRLWVLLSAAMIFSWIAALMVWRLLAPTPSPSVPPRAAPALQDQAAAPSPTAAPPVAAAVAAKTPAALAAPAAALDAKPKEVSSPSRKSSGERRRRKSGSSAASTSPPPEELSVPTVR